MLYNMKDATRVANQHNFAIGAFNIANSEFVEAVVEAAEEQNSPAILEFHPDELNFIGDSFIAYALKRAEASKVPIVVHLDHGSTFEDCKRAIDLGFTSVMIDASSDSFEDNVRKTKEVVSYAHKHNVSVEAELGTIGANAGTIEQTGAEIIYTNPDDVNQFVKQTDVDTLAVAIGTAHGKYPKDFVPMLRIDILEQITNLVSIPLVLHGGSSNDDEQIKRAIPYNIGKINISTDMKQAYYAKNREEFNKFSIDQFYEPNQVNVNPRKAAKELIVSKMQLFNSVNMADKY